MEKIKDENIEFKDGKKARANECSLSDYMVEESERKSLPLQDFSSIAALPSSSRIDEIIEELRGIKNRLFSIEKHLAELAS